MATTTRLSRLKKTGLRKLRLISRSWRATIDSVFNTGFGRRKTENKHSVLSALLTKQLELEHFDVTKPINLNSSAPKKLGFRSKAVIASVALGLCILLTASRYRNDKSTIPGNGDESSNEFVQEAIHSDANVDSDLPSQRRFKIDQSRKLLGDAIARLGSSDFRQSQQLRRLLIPRLLQLGGPWFREAERQVVLLNEEPGNPAAEKWMALALVGQLNESMSDELPAENFRKRNDYWKWLSFQKPGEVLFQAVESNSSDVDLLAHLVELAETNLDAFKFLGTDSVANSLHLQHRVASKLVGIESYDDSRSRLVFYRFASKSAPDVHAISKLSLNSDQVAQRLSDSIAPASCEETNRFNATSLCIDRPTKYWDFVLIKELADAIRFKNPEIAKQHYELLTSIDSGWMPATIIEDVYFLSGKHLVALGEIDNAAKRWEQGINRLDINSLKLCGAYADVIVKHKASSTKLCVAALKRFRKSAEMAKSILTKSPYIESKNSQRRSTGLEIQIALWRLRVLDAILQSGLGNRLEAIALLESTLGEQLGVESPEKVDAIIRLAEMYDEEGASDVAAATLERAIQIYPENLEFRAHAADAWSRAGDQERALENWKIVRHADSPQFQIAALEALFESELNQDPGKRVFRQLRSSANAIRHGMRETDSPERSDSHSNYRQIRWNSNQSDERLGTGLTPNWMGRLAILEFSIPPSGVSMETHIQSTELIESISTLSEDFKKDIGVQRFAAEFFAAVGNPKLSNSALQRIEILTGKGSFEATIARARIEASTGKLAIACKRLMDHAENQPEDSERVLLMAASWARQVHEFELAYDILLAIPSSRRSAFVLYSIAQVAESLPHNALVTVNQQIRPIELALRWKSELQKLEGQSGSWWKFLEATWLINHMLNERNEIAMDDPRLAQSKILLSDLDSRRPHWSEAISLSGAIKAIEKNPRHAVRELRRGIAAGDSQPKTWNLLQQQLLLLNQTEESTDESLLAKNSPGAFPQTSPAVELFLAAHTCMTRDLQNLPCSVRCRTCTGKKPVPAFESPIPDE